MTTSVDFYFDVASPTTYLAWTQLGALAEETGADFICKPVLLGAILKVTANQGPAPVPAKAAYMFDDLARYAARYGVPFQQNPHFPINSLPLQRGAIALLNTERFQDYLRAVFTAMWVDAKNLNDAEEIGRMLEAAGFEAGEVIAATSEQAVKDRLKNNTEEAVGRGAFGVPTFFVGKTMFFGQDRLSFVRDELKA